MASDFAIGNENLIEHIQWAHILLAYVTPGPAQEAAAIAYEQADEQDFWKDNMRLFKSKVDNMCRFLDELGLPVSAFLLTVDGLQRFNTNQLQYIAPSGAYIIFVNIGRLVVPENQSGIAIMSTIEKGLKRTEKSVTAQSEREHSPSDTEINRSTNRAKFSPQPSNNDPKDPLVSFSLPATCFSSMIHRFAGRTSLKPKKE